MFVVVYQFAVKPEHESQFVKAWLNTTKGIVLHKGGLGSRLHRDKAGSFIAYAQWPDEYTFQAAKKSLCLKSTKSTGRQCRPVSM